MTPTAFRADMWHWWHAKAMAIPMATCVPLTRSDPFCRPLNKVIHELTSPPSRFFLEKLLKRQRANNDVKKRTKNNIQNPGRRFRFYFLAELQVGGLVHC